MANKHPQLSILGTFYVVRSADQGETPRMPRAQLVKLQTNQITRKIAIAVLPPPEPQGQ